MTKPLPFTLLALVASLAAVQLNAQERLGGPRGLRGGPGDMLRASPIMQALDGDKDNEISAKEIDSSVAALMTLDKNKDGKLTEEELRPNFGDGGRGPGERGRGGFGERGGRGPEVPGGGGSVEELVGRIMAMDKNGDGKLTQDELPERMQSLMTRGDENKDGVLTKEEVTKLAQKEASASGGGPGELGERGEGGRGRFGGPGGRGEGGFRGGRGGPGGMVRMLPLMQALDADQDGELSAKEIENAVAALKTLDKNKDGKLAENELRPDFPEGGQGFGGRGPGGRGGEAPPPSGRNE